MPYQGVQPQSAESFLILHSSKQLSCEYCEKRVRFLSSGKWHALFLAFQTLQEEESGV